MERQTFPDAAERTGRSPSVVGKHRGTWRGLFGKVCLGAAVVAGGSVAAWRQTGSDPPASIERDEDDLGDLEALPPGTSLLGKTFWMNVPTSKGTQRVSVRLPFGPAPREIFLEVGRKRFGIDDEGKLGDLEYVLSAGGGGVTFVSQMQELPSKILGKNVRNTAKVQGINLAAAIAAFHGHTGSEPLNVLTQADISICGAPAFSANLNIRCYVMPQMVAAAKNDQ